MANEEEKHQLKVDLDRKVKLLEEREAELVAMSKDMCEMNKNMTQNINSLLIHQSPIAQNTSVNVSKEFQAGCNNIIQNGVQSPNSLQRNARSQ